MRDKGGGGEKEQKRGIYIWDRRNRGMKGGAVGVKENGGVRKESKMREGRGKISK